MKEVDLYAPIKLFLEQQGYEVKSEIKDCDLVAIRGDDPPVIVELKLSLSLDLLMQGITRQTITDAVYVAVPRGKGKAWAARTKSVTKICKRLGLGLISVRFEGAAPIVLIHTDPCSYKTHKIPRRKTALLQEFQRRVGDPNTGGQTRRAIITAYRQDALRIARALQSGPSTPVILSTALNIPKAGSILQNDHYGWFFRVKRGVYDLSEKGREATDIYADILKTLAD